MQIRYSKQALRSLMRMPRNQAELIRAKIVQYAQAPGSLSANVTSLKGEPGIFRLRVGDWRVIFGQDGEVLDIIRIAPRGSAYE